MSYYMRFIVTDEKPINLTLLQEILRTADREYGLDRDEDPLSEVANLMYDGEILGEIEINRPDSEIFDEERIELQEAVHESACMEHKQVLDTLNQAQAIIALRVLWQGRKSEATLERIDPLWKWLFDNRDGLLQVDGEGYYNKSGLVCEVA